MLEIAEHGAFLLGQQFALVHCHAVSFAQCDDFV
jgi:hypothetical protein